MMIIHLTTGNIHALKTWELPPIQMLVFVWNITVLLLHQCNCVNRQARNISLTFFTTFDTKIIMVLSVKFGRNMSFPDTCISKTIYEFHHICPLIYLSACNWPKITVYAHCAHACVCMKLSMTHLCQILSSYINFGSVWTILRTTLLKVLNKLEYLPMAKLDLHIYTLAKLIEVVSHVCYCLRQPLKILLLITITNHTTILFTIA
jgi:hypothetical protein